MSQSQNLKKGRGGHGYLAPFVSDHHLRAVLVAVLFQILHERRAAGADIGVIARDTARLLVDVACRVLQMPRAETSSLFHTGVERIL